jgi:hypothetical protein
VTCAAGGRGPRANGQPDETRTLHQPNSIPRMPQRGRECQWRQPGSPRSSLDTITQRCSSGAAIIRSTRPRFASSRSARRASSACASRRRTARASRTRSSSAVESTRGPPIAPTPHRSPDRGNAEAKSSPRRRSRRAIWRRRSSRAARSALAGTGAPSTSAPGATLGASVWSSAVGTGLLCRLPARGILVASPPGFHHRVVAGMRRAHGASLDSVLRRPAGRIARQLRKVVISTSRGPGSNHS